MLFKHPVSLNIRLQVRAQPYSSGTIEKTTGLFAKRIWQP